MISSPESPDRRNHRAGVSGSRRGGLGRRLERSRSEPDGGFIMITFGLLLIPIMIFTALAVDVSSWYSRATELQRSADAAALGGVVWMPDIGRANGNSEAVLVRNGMASDTDGLTVTKGVGDQANSYEVCITDESVTQFFGVVFASPTKMTRCATAMYDLPLHIGSPLNFVGGYDNGFADVGGQPYIPPTPEVPPYNGSSPPDNNVSIRPSNYSSATTYGQRRGCKWVHSTFSGRVYGWYWSQSGTRWPGGTDVPADRGRLDTRQVYSDWVYTPSGWQYGFNADELPDCEWNLPGTPYDPGQPYIAPKKLIRPEMNPQFWLGVEAPGTDAVQGDRYSPRCYGRAVTYDSSCPSNSPNPEYREEGYFFTLDVRESAPYIYVQAFDAAFRSRSTQQTETGDYTLGAGTWYTNFEILAPDSTPFDPTDNPVLSSGTCGGGTGEQDYSASWSFQSTTNYSDFINQWRTLCRLEAPSPTTNHSHYILRVWSSSTSGVTGNGVNNYALRAVATTTTDLDETNYPVDALPLASQPSLAAWQNMSIYVNVSSSDSASFFLAQVTPNYANKVLVLELYDSAEGATSLTVNNPDGVQRGCIWTSRKLADVSGISGGGNGGVIGAGGDGLTNGDCTVTTGGSKYNGRLLTIKMPIPADYTCDDSYRPPRVDTTTWQNGCWWSISYNVDNAHDATTWGAHIEGDPVRLIQ